jgi:hypothetical protein
MPYLTRAVALLAPTLGWLACGDDRSPGAADATAVDAMVAIDGPGPIDARPAPDAPPPAVCGNDVREDGEECDDGNDDAGDG